MLSLLVLAATICALVNGDPYESAKPYDAPKPYAPEHYEVYENHGTGLVKGVTGGITSAIGKGAVGVGSVLAAKKGLILAPFVLGAKAAVFSGPMAVGAVLGAPVGAVVGAKVGAVKGALLAKAAVAGKLALVKSALVGKAALAKSVIAGKAALAKKAVVAAKAIVMKPIALAVGATAAAATAKASLVSKGMTIIHNKVEDVHSGFVNAGTQIKTTVSTLANSVNLLQSLLPLLLASQNNAGNKDYNEGYTKTTYKSPSTLEATYSVDTPVTGYHYGKANFVAARRKRSPQRPQIQPQQQGATVERMNQLLTLVNQQKQAPCVQKVICELSVDPNRYGPDGVRFGFALLQFSFLDHPGTGPYKAAAQLGAKYRDARVCRTEKCQIPSEQLIRLGLTLLGI